MSNQYMQTPRCGQTMRSYDQPGFPHEHYPICGRPAGHYGPCLSERAWQNVLSRQRRKRKANRK